MNNFYFPKKYMMKAPLNKIIYNELGAMNKTKLFLT